MSRDVKNVWILSHFLKTTILHQSPIRLFKSQLTSGIDGIHIIAIQSHFDIEEEGYRINSKKNRPRSRIERDTHFARPLSRHRLEIIYIFKQTSF